MKRLVVTSLAATLVLGATLTNVASATPSPGKCRQIDLKVALAEGAQKNHTVSGTHCTPRRAPKAQKQIDVLTHGATYTRSYWDFPYGGLQYSYVNQTLLAGRSTFAYDVLGAGKSSRPLSTELSTTSDAHVLHQIVQWAKQQGYPTVNSISHSLGSAIATREAATYKDVSRVVLTGWAHGSGPGAAVLGANTYPATSDPKFAGQTLDEGYATTKPGIRGEVFYYLPSSDPKVIAKDEATKDVVSSTLRNSAVADRSAPAATNISQQITAPVFTVVGAFDALQCPLVFDCTSLAATRANETPFYSNAASFTAWNMPHTGHDLALSKTAPATFLLIDNWIRRTPAA
jgi:pimeloyl-ACP methyl ester carboxylesterase